MCIFSNTPSKKSVAPQYGPLTERNVYRNKPNEIVFGGITQFPKRKHLIEEPRPDC